MNCETHKQKQEYENGYGIADFVYTIQINVDTDLAESLSDIVKENRSDYFLFGLYSRWQEINE